MKEKPTTFRLTTEAREMLQEMASKFGMSQTAIVEVAIREKAKREHIRHGKTEGDNGTVRIPISD